MRMNDLKLGTDVPKDDCRVLIFNCARGLWWREAFVGYAEGIGMAGIYDWKEGMQCCILGPGGFPDNIPVRLYDAMQAKRITMLKDAVFGANDDGGLNKVIQP